MATTKIADVIVPEIFSEYLMEPILVKNALFDSGMVESDALLSSFLTRGGSDFKFPYWGELDNDALEVPQQDVVGTINKITTKQLTVPRQFRAFNAGADKFASILAGSNAMKGIQTRVVEAWQKGIQTTLVATLEGMLTTAGAGLVNDVASPVSAGDPNITNNISSTAIIDAQTLLGDQSGTFSSILMHSAVYAEMRKDNLITFVPLSEQEQNIPFYQDMRVIVDDRLYNFTRTAASTNVYPVYTTFLVKAAAFKYGQSEEGFTPVHIEVDETKGVGTETLYTRKMFALAPKGFDWTGTAVLDEGPSDTELAIDTNWALKFGINTSGFVAIYSNATDASVLTIVSIAGVLGVITPVTGATPVTTITEATEYTGTVTWAAADNPFLIGTVYTATITLTAKSGYTLYGVAEDFFTVAGATATNPANSGVITAVFPVTV